MSARPSSVHQQNSLLAMAVVVVTIAEDQLPTIADRFYSVHRIYVYEISYSHSLIFNEITVVVCVLPHDVARFDLQDVSSLDQRILCAECVPVVRPA